MTGLLEEHAAGTSPGALPQARRQRWQHIELEGGVVEVSGFSLPPAFNKQRSRA
jgi:hypothetical protein